MADMEKIKKLEKSAPKMTEKELHQLNALFPSYIFRRRRTREIWTTCCGKYSTVPVGSEILNAMHTPEPRPIRIRCGHGAWGAPPPPPTPEPAACPFCGKVSPVKELGRTGRRDNLRAYRRAIVFRWFRGALWATAYNLSKKYRTESDLVSMPCYSVRATYRFTPGKAACAMKYSWLDQWNSYTELCEQSLKPKFKFYEPFTCNAEYGLGYDVVALEEVNKSTFRYCGIQEFFKKSSSLMRYLALCTVYPRQVEMLTKSGLTDIVKDFVDRKKANVAIFDWNEPNPVKSFGLSKVEMKEFLSVKRKDVEVLHRYKQLKKKKLKCGIRELHEFKDLVCGSSFSEIMPLLIAHKITPRIFRSYLEKEQSRSSAPKRWPLYSGVIWWKDYIGAAKVLGYDLNNPIFLLPRDLSEHHDQATKAAAIVLESKRKETARERDFALCQKLSKRYTYSDGSYLIRPPLGAAEIVAEGKALRHCVGGYADRHINERTAILFLRDRNRPGHPLCTIEMHGNTLIQIHGWDDERTACKDNPKREDPKTLYKHFLDPWLEWIKAGSKRDKLGRPIIRHKKRKDGAA